eukprot:61275-Rhodomonas_salina.1
MLPSSGIKDSRRTGKKEERERERRSGVRRDQGDEGWEGVSESTLPIGHPMGRISISRRSTKPESAEPIGRRYLVNTAWPREDRAV